MSIALLDATSKTYKFSCMNMQAVTEAYILQLEFSGKY